jgi:hypothetical protein
MMKLDTLETHDRLLHFQKAQADYISQGCQDCFNNRPAEFGNHPFYVFAHKREIGMDERVALFSTDMQRSLVDLSYIRQYMNINNVPTHRMIWSPRLTKPRSQENSMCFRYPSPPSDVCQVFWILVDAGAHTAAAKGQMTENKTVTESMHHFINNRAWLDKREEGDLGDEEANQIYRQIAFNKANTKQHVMRGTRLS